MTTELISIIYQEAKHQPIISVYLYSYTTSNIYVEVNGCSVLEIAVSHCEVTSLTPQSEQYAVQ